MIRTLGRTILLSAVAFVAMQSGARAAEEENSLGRIPEFQKKLNTPITYELAIDTTLDKALDELLKQNGIPYVFNEAAITAVGGDAKAVVQSPVNKIDKMEGVTRATILKKLLEKIPIGEESTTPTFVLRPDHLEITNRRALLQQLYDYMGNADVPPLVYLVFKETPYHDALTELAHAARVNVIVDDRGAGDFKVSAELNAVPVDAALRILANMRSLKVVRIANVYYVTSPKNARMLQNEEKEARSLQTPIAAQ